MGWHLLLWLSLITGQPVSGNRLQLVILHYGNIDGRFEKVMEDGRPCNSPTADICIGGVAKAVTMINYFQDQDKYNTIQKTVHIFTGGIFRGTAWYQVGKQKISAEFMKVLNPDVMALGVSEFSEGLSALAEYIEGAQVPVIAANLDVSRHAELKKINKIKRSLVIMGGQVKIGIVGFVSRDILKMYPGGEIKIGEELSAIQAEIANLKTQNVKIFIVVGDVSFNFAKVIAQKVADVHVVLTCSDVLQYNGKAPVMQESEHPYPLMVHQDRGGRRVAVASSGQFGVYVGRMVAHWSGRAGLDDITGQPVLLGAGYPGDAAVLRLLETWRAKLNVARSVVVGQTSVLLRGGETTCNQQECSLGNLVTDAVIEYQRSHDPVSCSEWTRTASAMMHSAALTNSIDAPAHNGNVTSGDIMDALAYNNHWVRCSPTGQLLIEVLEYAVAGKEHGTFVQLSGLWASYDLSQPPGERVVAVMRRCQKCLVPSYDYLNVTDVHHVLVPAYMALGGSGFPLMPGCDGVSSRVKLPETEVLEWYFRTYSPLYPEEEKRITVYKKEGPNLATPTYRRGAWPAVVGVVCVLFVTSVL